MRQASVCATALSAGAIVLCGMSTPVAATEQPSESTLVITAWDSSGIIAEQIYEVVLKCDPPGGTHVNAQQACDTLTAVNGDFEALEPSPDACMLIYKPVYIEVGGNWRDQVVHFQHNYSNLCLAEVESAGVFSFTDQ
jgi:hypothetical protein